MVYQRTDHLLSDPGNTCLLYFQRQKMTGKEYQEAAMRTNDHRANYRLDQAIQTNLYPYGYDLGGVLNGCLGLAGETGELLDMIKKWIFHEKPLEIDHAKKELGDVMWYIAMICHSFNWDLDEILKMNVDKLKARYPEGFDVDLSAHRKEGDL